MLFSHRLLPFTLLTLSLASVGNAQEAAKSGTVPKPDPAEIAGLLRGAASNGPLLAQADTKGEGKAGSPGAPVAPSAGASGPAAGSGGAQAPAPGGPASAGEGPAQGGPPGGGRGGFGGRTRGGFGGLGGGIGGAPGQEDTTLVALENGEQLLNFPNNAVTDLLAAYEKLTGMTLIKDTAVFEGSPVSLTTPKAVGKDEAIRLIEATLLINGYAIVLDPGGKSARILPTRVQGAAQMQFSQGVKFYTDAKQLPEGETLVTFFMKLDHLAPEDAGTILNGHVGLNVYGRITPVTTPPGLLITETASIVRQLITIKETIDSVETTSSLVTKFVKLEFADASVVAQIVQSTLDAQAKEKEAKGITTIRGQAVPERSSKSSSSGAPPPPSSSSSSSSSRASTNPNDHNALPTPSSQVVADPRLNQILIVATAEDYAYITSLIQEFDKPVKVEEPFEHKLKYAFCIDVMPALADLMKDPTGTGTSQLPGGGTLNLNQQQPLTSSSSQLLTGTRGTNRRGAQLAGNASSTASSGDGSTGGSTTSGAVGSSRADQLIPPQEDNAPISMLIGKTRIIADPPSNTIIVIGPKEAVDKARMLLERLDRKPAQVYLATIIGELTVGDNYELGIDYLTSLNQHGDTSLSASSIFRRSDVISGNNITDLRDNLITTPFGPASGLNLYGQIAGGVEAFVNALQTKDHFKVLSRPSVFALNNKKATIVSGSQIPVPYQSVTTAGNNINTNGTVTTTVQFKDVVLKLEVVPLINPDNEVTLTIAQINDTVTGTQRVEPNDVPIIGTEQLVTTVSVPDGNTVALGGLISDNHTKSDSGIPVLSRIPLIGNVFRNTKRKLDRKELLVFIQPHVVTDDDKLRQWSNNEDIRTSVGADAAERFPTNAPEARPAGEQPKRKNWLQRVFNPETDRTRNSDIHPLKHP